MSYTALYRKFRPERFEDVKGQDAIVTTLKNQIMAGRVGHAYLFCGTRGTGKTTIAKIYAKAVNCENPVDGSPCGECKSCRTIAAGASMNVIEIDAASNNGVDNIREIVDEVSYSPAEGKYKVYIIDEVHMLSIGAFNALLKTLEEPPSYVIFILATTEVHKIPVTILSRCQRYDFKRISVDTIAGRMRELMDTEGQQVEERALQYISRAADGSMRDALSLLDQCIAFHYGKELTYENALDVLGAVDTQVFSSLLRAILERSVSRCIGILDEVVMQGRELTQFVSDFTWYLRSLLLVKTSEEGTVEEVIDISRDNLVRLKEEAQIVEADAIMRFIREMSELSGKLRYAGQKRIQIEITLIRLCRPQMEVDADSLLDRIRAIEEKLEKGILSMPAERLQEAAVPAAKPVRKAPLPAAIPEDIRRIVESWPGLAGQAAMPMKQYLKKARLSLGGDNRLVVVVEDGLASDYFLKQEGNKEELEKMLSAFLEKTVEVTVQAYKEERDFQENHVDLSQVIHMEIEEDEN